jgi:hypothetical protein
VQRRYVVEVGRRRLGDHVVAALLQDEVVVGVGLLSHECHSCDDCEDVSLERRRLDGKDDGARRLTRCFIVVSRFRRRCGRSWSVFTLHRSTPHAYRLVARPLGAIIPAEAASVAAESAIRTNRFTRLPSTAKSWAGQQAVAGAANRTPIALAHST